MSLVQGDTSCDVGKYAQIKCAQQKCRKNSAQQKYLNWKVTLLKSDDLQNSKVTKQSYIKSDYTAF